MTNVLEQKQIIHIVVEIVVLTGVSFYFASKNKQLSSSIQALSKKLEEQEEIIQRHEQILMQLVKSVNQNNNNNVIKPVTVNIIPDLPIKKNKDPKIVSVKAQPLKNEVSESENESDLDDEIEEELKELEKDDDLKKKS